MSPHFNGSFIFRTSYGNNSNFIDDEQATEQASSSSDSTFTLPLIVVGIFVTAVLIVHFIVSYIYRSRPRLDEDNVLRLKHQQSGDIPRGVESRNTTCSNTMLTNVITHVEIRDQIIGEDVNLSNGNLWSKCAQPAVLPRDVIDSDPTIRCHGDFIIGSPAVQSLRSTCLHLRRPTPPDSTKIKAKPNLFCEKQPYKKNNSFEFSRTSLANVSSPLGNNTRSTPTMYYIEGSGSPPTFPYICNDSRQNDKELYSSSVLTSLVQSPHNSRMISRDGACSFLGSGLDFDFGASVGFSGQIASSDHCTSFQEECVEDDTESDDFGASQLSFSWDWDSITAD
ncbi:uncharacterized protein LOC102805075 [Saccoglossus kowalevskii]|uniref:Uncharacterized protein LOC102805075 n=1 Tax=Saccoglossus kowalevskii TaxID=10224 RepID=A0ABM0MYQ9_SACKO|nr:PREDICTED: uncharacterized protein LOC102805075 [Saccoglossus kowalevskii]